MTADDRIPLTYSDGSVIEPFDHVELHHEDRIYEDAIVTTLLPMSGMVRVHFKDPFNPLRNGDPRRRTIRAAPADIELIRRDG